jgi:hypothetical protein
MNNNAMTKQVQSRLLFFYGPGEQQRRLLDYSFRAAPTGDATAAAAAVADRRVLDVSRLNWRILYNSAL